jgi:hypothetical protein
MPRECVKPPVGFLLVFLVVVAICAFLTSVVAESKGHHRESWFLVGLFLGPLGLLASLGLPDLKTRKYLRLIAEKQGVDLSGEPEMVQKKEGAPYDYTYWERYDRKPKE